MQFAGMNYLAIVVAAAAGFIFGALYGSAAAALGRKAAGLPDKTSKKRPAAVFYADAMTANLVMAWVLAGVIGHLGPGQVTLRNSIISAVFIWFGFIVTALTVTNTAALRRPVLSVIDGGRWLGTLMIMGAVIGAFGV
jgi:hypothetical protein